MDFSQDLLAISIFITVRWPTFSIQLYLAQEYLWTRWWLWIRKRNLDHSLFTYHLQGGHTEIWQRWLCQSWQHSPYSHAVMVSFRSSNQRHAFYRPNLNYVGMWNSCKSCKPSWLNCCLVRCAVTANQVKTFSFLSRDYLKKWHPFPSCTYNT